MKALIIYISIHQGNTKKIAEKIAEVLNAELLNPNEVDEKTLTEYDLIGFGSGIYMGKHHKSLLNLIDKLPDMKNKKAFIFSTSGMDSSSSHGALKNKLLEKGFNIVEEFSCKGFDKWGPFKLIGGINKGRPNEKDIIEAENLANSLKEKI